MSADTTTRVIADLYLQLFAAEQRYMNAPTGENREAVRARRAPISAASAAHGTAAMFAALDLATAEWTASDAPEHDWDGSPASGQYWGLY